MGHHLLEATDLEIILAHYHPSDDEIYQRALELILPVNPILAAARLNRSNVDVVHFSPLSIFAPINGLRAKKVATIHSAEPTMLPEGYSWIRRAHEKHIVPRYARRLCASVPCS